MLVYHGSNHVVKEPQIIPGSKFLAFANMLIFMNWRISQMDKNKFDTIIPVITAHLVDRISATENILEDEAIEKLYASQLYAFLEDEKTKVWQYSTDKLYDLYKSEKTDGKLELPEY